MRRMWENFTTKEALARSVLVDVEKERQEGIEGVGNRSRHTQRSWSLSGTSLTCALKVYQCAVHSTQEVR